MSVLERNIEYALAIARARDNLPYGYGGCWKRFDISATTDCSGIVTHILDALLHGAEMTWSRHGISTEAYRVVPPGAKGPFGTLRAKNPGAIPDDAILKIGLVHGGGGPFSHMSCTLKGIAIESAGQPRGQQVGPPARGFDHPLYKDWFYLPGPLTPVGAQPEELVFLQLGARGIKVLAMQKKLNKDYPLMSALEEDGDFGAQTERVVMDFQRRSGLVVDGIAGPATLGQLGLPVLVNDDKWDEFA